MASRELILIVTSFSSCRFISCHRRAQYVPKHGLTACSSTLSRRCDLRSVSSEEDLQFINACYCCCYHSVPCRQSAIPRAVYATSQRGAGKADLCSQISCVWRKGSASLVEQWSCWTGLMCCYSQVLQQAHGQSHPYQTESGCFRQGSISMYVTTGSFLCLFLFLHQFSFMKIRYMIDFNRDCQGFGIVSSPFLHLLHLCSITRRVATMLSSASLEHANHPWDFAFVLLGYDG